MLVQFAERLCASVRSVDFVARLGGDEFLVVVEEVGQPDHLDAVARKVIAAMERPFDANGHRIVVTTSIGIAPYQGSRRPVDALVRSADQAMYQAKRSGRNTFRLAAESHPEPAGGRGPSPMAALLGGAAAAAPSDLDGFIRHALHSIRTHLGMDVAFISQFVQGRRVFRFVDAAQADSPIVEGGSDPLEEGFCQRVVDGRLPELMPDAFLNDHAAAMPVTHALPVRAHLSVPIRLRDGAVYGTYCCFSARADQSLNARDLDMMRVFADLVARQLEAG